jgi:hypothetical protein
VFVLHNLAVRLLLQAELVVIGRGLPSEVERRLTETKLGAQRNHKRKKKKKKKSLSSYFKQMNTHQIEQVDASVVAVLHGQLSARLRVLPNVSDCIVAASACQLIVQEVLPRRFYIVTIELKKNHRTLEAKLPIPYKSKTKSNSKSKIPQTEKKNPENRKPKTKTNK